MAKNPHTRRSAMRGPGDYTQPVYAQIVGVLPEDHAIQVQYSDRSGIRTVQAEGTYVSMNSGRRNMPEVGSYVLLSFRQGDSTTPMVVRYVSADEYNAVIQGGQIDPSEGRLSPASDNSDTPIGTNPYRALQSGELEDFSSGGARNWLSSRGRNEQNAGNISWWGDRDDLEFGVAAPEFRVEGSRVDGLRMADCMRFGAISRHVGDSRAKTYAKKDGQIGKEFYYNLQWGGTPENLVTHTEGVVTDAQGVVRNDSVTGLPLRRITEYGTVGGDTTDICVDEAGNVHIELASSATQGMFVNAKGGNSNVTENFGQDHTRSVSRNASVKIGSDSEEQVGGNKTFRASGNHNQTTGGNHTINAGGTFRVSASAIYLN